jgi:2-polyprenyl-6-methoxyphenol hydroxylase-like FAD-dependent oxidoreductase
MSKASQASLQLQGGVVTNVQNPKLAGDADGDQRLDYLGVHHVGVDALSQYLTGLRVMVIGAGPAGLVFARNAALHGAVVTILEQAGDPRGTDAGYTNRSFNITLDNVGRQVLGDARAWKGGIWLNGRAIHCNVTADVTYARYGRTVDAELISIPRPVLRQNLCKLAEEAGATILFHARATGTNTATGAVAYESVHGNHEEIHGDLVVFGDGLHSLVTSSASAELGIQTWPEPRNYISGMIAPEDNPGLSLGHIHFWHEQNNGNFSVGIPNADGSVALLIVSLFADIAADAHPFATPAQAEARLRRDFPHLYTVAPQLAEQLPHHRRGTFCFKSAQKYRVGQKGVIVGDAGLVFPPWAGYGANQAMYGAASMANALVEHRGVLDSALDDYQQTQQLLSAELIEFVDGQGDFLSGPVAKDPAGRSEPALSMIIQEVKHSLAREDIMTEPDASPLENGSCTLEPAV